jgi:hypothetical protein
MRASIALVKALGGDAADVVTSSGG